jgi:uncharacterized protein (TIGR02145 family)
MKAAVKLEKSYFLFFSFVLFGIVACGDDNGNISNTTENGENPALAENGKDGNMLFVDDRDGRKYSTVVIGTQTWMSENLNFETSNSYCYGHNASNCTKYGRLYEWNTAMKACPSGWHVPSRAEFETFFEAVGGMNFAGRTLKYASNGISNDDDTDSFGFKALPAGGFWGDDFIGGGSTAFFWSSSDDVYQADFISLDFSIESAGISSITKTCRFSVRCLKD